jgi:hypothetical protein
MKVKNVEKAIWDIEGFDVCVKHPDGKDVRGDRSDFPTYRFQRAAPDRMTVNGWKRSRFRQVYPGYDVDVLLGGGTVAMGNVKLRTVRDSYI